MGRREVQYTKSKAEKQQGKGIKVKLRHEGKKPKEQSKKNMKTQDVRVKGVEKKKKKKERRKRR